jgi:cation/acetate symporter
VFTNILGRDISTLQAVQALPSWIFTYGNLGLVKICGANAASAEALLAACQAKGAAVLDFSQFSIAADTIVLATPEIAGLPYVIAGLVAAGGLAAALSTADGLLLAIANALSPDVYYKMIDHTASTKRRLTVARILLVMVALLGAWTAVTLPQSILIFVSWAFSVAASGLFAALVLGVFWKRCTSAGAIAGMIAGFLICVYYTFGTEYYGVPLWFQNSALTTKGLSNIAAGVIGIPVSFLVTIVVSLLTPAPSRQMQEFIDAIRVPRGEMVMGEAVKAD